MVLAVIGAVAAVFRPKFPERLLDGLHRRLEVLALVGLFVIGALWLANAERYSTVHWLFWAVPYLENFRIPSRFLMVSAAAVLSLGAVGLELGLRSSTTRARAVFTAGALLSLGTGGSMPIGSNRRFGYAASRRHPRYGRCRPAGYWYLSRPSLS